MNSAATEALIVVACIVGIIAGGIFILGHVDVHCFNFFGLTKGCAVTAH